MRPVWKVVQRRVTEGSGSACVVVLCLASNLGCMV